MGRGRRTGSHLDRVWPCRNAGSTDLRSSASEYDRSYDCPNDCPGNKHDCPNGCPGSADCHGGRDSSSCSCGSQLWDRADDAKCLL